MSLQDKLEQILREFHVLMAESKVYNASENEIIVNKKEVFDLLNRLNVAVYEVMDNYEMTQSSRDKAEREAKKKGEEIVRKADAKAEDVYAASILYTSDALSRIQSIMQEAIDSFEKVCDDAKEKMAEEKRTVRSNQTELTGQLQDFRDTDKYLDIINEANKRIEKEKAEKEEGLAEVSSFKGIKPEIRVNTEYLDRIGATRMKEEMEEAERAEELKKDEEAAKKGAREKATINFEKRKKNNKHNSSSDVFSDIEFLDLNQPKKAAPEVKVNFDSEYFKRLRAAKKSE